MSNSNPINRAQTQNNPFTPGFNFFFFFGWFCSLLLIIVVLLEYFNITNFLDKTIIITQYKELRPKDVSEKYLLRFYYPHIKSKIYSFQPSTPTETQSGDTFIKKPSDVYRFVEKNYRLSQQQSEKIYPLFLDRNGKLLNADKMLVINGDDNHVHFQLDRIDRSLNIYPEVESIILVHNHPNSDAHPSITDLVVFIGDTHWTGKKTNLFTHYLSKGIQFDAIIIAKNQIFSLEVSRLITRKWNELNFNPGLIAIEE